MIDARDHGIAMRGVAGGAEPLTTAELVAYLAAAMPLAFWRKRCVGVLSRILKVLCIRLEDLVAD